MHFGPFHDGLCTQIWVFFTYTNFTHVKMQCFKNSGQACVLGRVASPWLRPRASALQRPLSSASAIYFPSLFSFPLARSLLLFAFPPSFRSRSLSFSRAPRLQVRRDCASVLGIRTSLIFESFRYPLVNLEDNKILWAFARWAQHAFLRRSIFFAPSLCAPH